MIRTIATIGTKTNALPTYAMTSKNIITKGKSITDKIVAEVIKTIGLVNIFSKTGGLFNE